MSFKTGVGKFLRILVRVALLWMVIHLVFISFDGLRDYKGTADVAVVLGNRVDADSSLSPVLQGRVDRALLLYRQGRVRKIMVSGGKGLKGAKVPEGMAMRRYLEQKGVPPADVIEDNDGENTYLTAKDFRTVADSLHYSSVIVVSSFYHITRCKYIFRKLDIKHVHSASSDVFYANDLVGLLREFPALYKYMLWY
ncbi:YdcF family protein [Flavitalea sp. BT771]|uniref:YdcF family protein n=1 Tax=Flavitalea sp. BT771 TaxID=3063329 RepID=UPI0026E29315|nr:YdcF family protein [Flavitalea sp. BT771]MDO6435419.1 YdcF family protein [Flavitalea sp. BT771]MDV6224221.1 YdcF family protein [Flavitalea sp. BT771]